MNAEEGQLIWNLSDRRRKRNPFCQETADFICELIATGHRLSSICKLVGMPSYQVICKWRRQNPEFNDLILMAYEDRIESLCQGISERSFRSVSQLKRSIAEIEKQIGRQIGVRYPTQLMQRTKKSGMIFFPNETDQEQK